MDELHTIVDHLAGTAPETACALATLVHVEGSSYRSVGARTLALPGGDTIGMISGGCLEGDLLERAGEVLADGRPRTVRYDSTAPEDALLGLGLGCNGIVDVLLERVSAADATGTAATARAAASAAPGAGAGAGAHAGASAGAGSGASADALAGATGTATTARAGAGAGAGSSAHAGAAAGAGSGAGAAAGADALAAAAALAGAAAGPDTAAGSRYLPLIAAARGRGLRSALGTVYRSANATEVGARLALVEQATGAEEHATSPQPHTFGHLRPSLREALARDLGALLRGGRSHSAEYQIEGAPVQVLLELIAPPLALTVCGAGPDAQPLVTLAANLGWAPVVFDHRAGFARPGRFPAALRVVSAPREEFSSAVPPRPGEVVVLMTHSYPTDLTYLEQLAARSVRYIGVLGPRRRLQRLLDELGPRAPAANVVYGPAGLDIGADSPPEIALSIVAEIRAVLADRTGTPLRRRPTPIHTAVTAGR